MIEGSARRAFGPTPVPAGDYFDVGSYVPVLYGAENPSRNALGRAVASSCFSAGNMGYQTSGFGR